VDWCFINIIYSPPNAKSTILLSALDIASFDFLLELILSPENL
jgi:hypothetical protein